MHLKALQKQEQIISQNNRRNRINFKAEINEIEMGKKQ